MSVPCFSPLPCCSAWSACSTSGCGAIPRPSATCAGVRRCGFWAPRSTVCSGSSTSSKSFRSACFWSGAAISGTARAARHGPWRRASCSSWRDRCSISACSTGWARWGCITASALVMRYRGAATFRSRCSSIPNTSAPSCPAPFERCPHGGNPLSYMLRRQLGFPTLSGGVSPQNGIRDGSRHGIGSCTSGNPISARFS